MGIFFSALGLAQIQTICPAKDPEAAKILEQLIKDDPSYYEFSQGDFYRNLSLVTDPNGVTAPFFLTVSTSVGTDYGLICPIGSYPPNREQLVVLRDNYRLGQALEPGSYKRFQSSYLAGQGGLALELTKNSLISERRGYFLRSCALPYHYSPEALERKALLDTMDQEFVLGPDNRYSFHVRKTHYFFISGESTDRRFYNDIRRGYESVKLLGESVNVFVNDGAWNVPQNKYGTKLSDFTLTGAPIPTKAQQQEGNPSYPPVSGPASTIKNIVDGILSSGIKAHDAVFLFFEGHGFRSDSAKTPHESQVCLLDDNASFKEMATELKRLPTGVRLKIITTSCYGGGLHSLARELPNVCTAAMTNFAECAWAGVNEMQFNTGFWDHFTKKEGKTSFLKASAAGFSKDDANLELGRLSSFDFVDYVLKRGPYDLSWPMEEWQQRETIYLESRDAKQVTHGKIGLSARQELGYKGATRADAELANLEPSEGLSSFIDDDLDSYFISTAKEDYNRLRRLEPILCALTRDPILGSPEVQTLFGDVIEDVEENWRHYSKLEEEIFRLEKLGLPKNHLVEDSELLERIYYNHQILNKLGDLIEFIEKASFKQKKKFIQLLSYEVEEL